MFTLPLYSTLELIHGLQSPPGSAVGPGRPARRLGSPGSTTCCRPSLERGPPSHRRSPAAAAGWTARAPACCHETAACCRLAAIESSFHRRSRQPPATHGVQPVVRLHCGQEARAGGGCSTCIVDGADWRGMASTATMVPKDLSHWSPPCALYLPTHQRGRWMDGAAHVWGPSHRRRQQLQRWPMRFVSPPAW